MNKVAVITGAASGIGLALARQCLQRDFHVVMADNAVSNLCDRVEQLSREAKTEILGVVCDVSKPESVKNLANITIERFKRIDWLFNNAGISGYLEPIWELSLEHVRKVIDVNLYGIIHGIHTFLPLMFAQSHPAHIINMASFYALCSGSQIAPYSMSKHAILALSESLYYDLQRLNKAVNISVVCPSFTNTGLLHNSPPLTENSIHPALSTLIERGRSAEEVAEHIINEVEKNRFYILPDLEVKHFCEERTQAIIQQIQPYQHTYEKMMSALSESKLKDQCFDS